jgi:hypothetical protein
MGQMTMKNNVTYSSQVAVFEQPDTASQRNKLDR